MTPPQLKQNQRDAHSKYYTMYFTRCFKTMVQLLSSLLPEEAVLMRTDRKVSFVIVEKESRSKTIRSHRVRRNQNTGQTWHTWLALCKKVSTNSSCNSLSKFYLPLLWRSNIFLHARWSSKCPMYPVCSQIRNETCSNLTFREPWIVIYSYNKTNEMH
jgi:hypothetical protein